MIDHIKSLYADGQGLSIRAIAQQLKLSRNTVCKYLRLDETEISRRQDDRSRHKYLDGYRDFIVYQLQTYPRLSAVKMLRKLHDYFADLTVFERTVRRYIEVLRESVAVKQSRYYMPVLDMVPGVQCQVDPGELRGVVIGGRETVVYFVVFVLSYSRLMYAAVSQRPINTTTFICMHDAAFRSFGGCPQECVYDQTKMVVLKEEFRELTLNEQFHEYANHAGFRIHACEGYDPESKGKIEAGVKYVKANALYGETFSDWSALAAYLAEWLDTTANVRCHATTREAPQARYDAACAASAAAISSLLGMQPTRAQVVPYSPPSIKTTLSVHAMAARKARIPAEPAPITATSTYRLFMLLLPFFGRTKASPDGHCFPL